MDNDSCYDHHLETKDIMKKYGIENIKKKMNYIVDYNINLNKRENSNIIFSPHDKSLFILIFLTLEEPCNIAAFICASLLAILYISNKEEKQHLMVFIFTAIIIVFKTAFEVYEEAKINKFYRIKIDKYKSHIAINNNIYEIEKDKLQIGDILVLKKGDVVGADAVLISANNLLVDSSSLTGSHQILRKNCKKSNLDFKNADNVVLGSDKIISGRAKAIVVRIGNNSELGKKSKVFKLSKRKENILFTKIDEFFIGSMIFSAFFAICCILIAMIQRYSFVSIFTLVVSIFVAVLPEGISSVLKLQLNTSVSNLEDKGLHIRDVSAIEKLGVLSTILTNKKTVDTLNFKVISYIFDGYEMTDVNLAFDEKNEEKLKIIEKIGNYCSYISESIKDKNHTINSNLYSIMVLANIFNCYFIGYYRIPEIIKYKKVNNINVTIVKFDKFNLVLAVGAIDSLIKHCKFFRKNKKLVKIKQDFIDKIYKINDKLANDGKLSLLLALGTYGCNENNFEINNLVFESLLFLEEQVDLQTPIAVELLKASNVGVSILTKNKDVSNLNFCKDVLGIENKSLTKNDKIISFKDFRDLTLNSQNIFLNNSNFIIYDAQTDNKIQIYDQVKDSKKMVAFWGSEIQDSVILNYSDLGICFASSSQICKESSSIIVNSHKFEDILYGIEEGRLFFVNFQKSVKYILLHITPQLLAFLFYVLLGTPISVSPILLIFLNYFVEIIPAKFFVCEEPEVNLLSENPLTKNDIVNEQSYVIDANRIEYNYSFKEPIKSLKKLYKNLLDNPIYPPSNITWSVIEAGLISGIGCMLSFYMVLYMNEVEVSDMFFSAEEYFLFGAKDLKLRNGIYIDFEKQLEILFSGQSTFFVGLIICQFSNMLVCRRKNTFFYYNFFNNPNILIFSLLGIFFSILILFIGFFDDFLLVRKPLLSPLIYPIISALLILIIDTYKKKNKILNK